MSVSTERQGVFRVLVVDDESAVRTFVDRVLRQHGYETRLAADGTEALTIADAEGPFDLLLADLTMPGLRGDEVARRLRTSHPDLKVLYLTGYADELFERRGTLWEDEAYLEKPTNPRGLHEAVSLILTGCLPAPRAPRVSVPGARVQLAEMIGALETLSITGTRVTAPKELAVGSTWPLVLELPLDTLHVTGRVVSVEPVPSTDSPAQESEGAFRIALAFDEPSGQVQRVLQRVCGGPV